MYVYQYLCAPARERFSEDHVLPSTLTHDVNIYTCMYRYMYCEYICIVHVCIYIHVL